MDVPFLAALRKKPEHIDILTRLKLVPQDTRSCLYRSMIPISSEVELDPEQRLTLPDILSSLHGSCMDEIFKAPRITKLGSFPSIVDGLNVSTTSCR
jgi:hypothetical protein